MVRLPINTKWLDNHLTTRMVRLSININYRDFSLTQTAIRQNDQETQMVHLKLSNKTSGMTIIHATTQMIEGDQRKKNLWRSNNYRTILMIINDLVSYSSHNINIQL